MTQEATRPQTIVPMLSYEDIGAAATWLTEAFGFEETERYVDDDGRPNHVELALGGDLVMLGTPGEHYVAPKHHRETCDVARRMYETPYVVDGLFAWVDDVDAHADRARAAGATLLSDPEDAPYGARIYRAEDLEGHRWMFAQRLSKGT